jgi:hypothetical protein
VARVEWSANRLYLLKLNIMKLVCPAAQGSKTRCGDGTHDLAI